MRFEGLIFDCDGVLVDSEPFSCGTWNVILKDLYNIDIGTNYNAILGKNLRDAAEYYSKKFNLPFDDGTLSKLTQLKEDTYYRIAKGKLNPIPGVNRIIQDAKKLNLKIAVASSGSINKIHFNLSQARLNNEFQNILSADDVKHAKPSPDIFLKAMSLMKVEPSKCIIIEDSVSGIRAAKSSGAFTIGLASTFPVENLYEADLIIENYNELDLFLLLKS
ncbi:HAD family hydrolase [Promethearchaeum syntrophicum]|uniref:HAD family hydrolase n=1 Tax=Promethearchaeum syntrophicum TaxID=2594042 RepID=A0A5B9DAA2_9ARCH